MSPVPAHVIVKAWDTMLMYLDVRHGFSSFVLCGFGVLNQQGGPRTLLADLALSCELTVIVGLVERSIVHAQAH